MKKLLPVSVSLLFSLPAFAQSDGVAKFYTGKRITLITSASVGGGYDLYARLLAAHMPRYIPGNPVITVQNMPGAEGIAAANYIYNIAPKDGTAFAGLQRNTALTTFYQPDHPGPRFDARKFTWLGSPQQEVGFLIVRTATGVRSHEDLRTREITVSSSTRNAPSSIYPRLLNATYGTKLRPIEGYDGSQGTLLAVERAETDSHASGGTSAAFRARYRPWEKAGDVKVILQLGMERDKEYPDVPTALEIVPAGEPRQMFEIAFAEQVMGRPFVLPPGIPADRAEALRKAFDETMTDKAFLEEAAKRGAEIDPVSGARINALLDRVFATPPALAQRIREIIK